MMILPSPFQSLFTWIITLSPMYFSGLFSLVLFIAVVTIFAYRRLKQERSKQGGGSSSSRGGGGGQNHVDDDLLVAINSSPPRVARWGGSDLQSNFEYVLTRRAPPPPYSEVPSAPDYSQQVP